MTATERAVTFICETDGASIPDDVRELGRRALLDTIGVTLAGSTQPTARLSREMLEAEGGDGRATVLGTPTSATLAGAALANGTAGHALDFDDVTSSMSGHPSIPLMPAALAAAESIGASGSDLVSAFLIGFEVECKVGRGLGRSHYARGFHQTTTLGTLGAAAACAKLWDLDEEQTAHALAIAASMSGGLRTNFGSMTKPLQAGNAARGGLVAAQLAKEGFTGGHDVLDGPIGFVNMYSPAGDGDIEQVDGFGDPWEAVDPGISVKKYPCCFVTHRAADATLSLAEQHDLSPDMIDHVEVHVPATSIGPGGAIGPLIHPRPQTGLEGKSSMEYVVSSALFDREIRLANFEDKAVQRPEIQEFLTRVRPVGDSERYPTASGDQYQAVEIHTKDGRVLAETVQEPRGGPSNPLTWDELLSKYHDGAARVLTPEAVERSAELLMGLDEVGNVREVTQALADTLA